MKPSFLWVFLCLGGFVLALLVGLVPPGAAVATEPTPTPLVAPATPSPDAPSNLACRLAHAADCEFIETVPEDVPVQSAVSNLPPRLYPPINARNVPTHTLISIIFDTDIDPGTINEDTFYVSQGEARLAGSVEFIDVNNIAIFYPAMPLRANTTYTASATRSIRDVSGLPLPQELEWSFTTTTSGVSPLANNLSLAAIPSPGGSMQIYFGDLHSHSSYSDGWGTPEQAYATARAVGLDFFALTDHAFMLTEAEWQATQAIADAATDPFFVGLHSFEYTHLYGHINVFDSDTFVHRDDPNYDTLAEFYAWLVAHPTAFAQFNHPLVNSVHDWNFHNFAYHPTADLKIVLQELSSADQFFLGLNKGWHLGSVGNSDAHYADWGVRRMGVLAPALTRPAILDGLRSRRTFFASPSHIDFAVVMQANSAWMGSAIPPTGSINFIINAYDPYPPNRSLRLNLFDNGFLIASASIPSREWYTWTPAVPATYGHYYYVEAYYDHWVYPAYTSPIWVEKRPIAWADSPPIVPPGTLVALDGRASHDPDGDALAYRWIQQAGPAVSLSQDNTALATFVAPNTVGDFTFELSVTDPGGLSDAAATVVKVTDKPILSITKSGPAAARSGDPITYLLTVTNHGITPASNVVVTDILPDGATYVSGGLLSGDTVSWTIPNLAANGAAAQVSFTVTANGPIVNDDYRAACTGCIPAVGQAPVLTNGYKFYLPLVRK